MKSTFAILTLFVAALAITPRQSFGQYAWVPVYKDAAAAEAYNTAPGQTGYATYVGEDAPIDEDLMDFSDDNSGGCKVNCDCPRCRHDTWVNRSYVGVEFLQWYSKGRALPPLVTGGNPLTTPFTAAGQLPASPVLFGGDEVGRGLQAGARLTGGIWFDDCKTTGIVIRAFGSEGDRTTFAANSLGNPILAIPFVDQGTINNGLNNSLVLAYAGGATPGINAQGGVTAVASNDVFGGDVYGRTVLDQGCDYRFDLLAGYQMSRIDDDLELRTNLQRFDVAGNPTFTTSDLFDVENEFHGGTLGLMGEFDNGPLTIQMLGKIGVGNMNQRVRIAGTNAVNGVQTGGGFFAQDQAGNGGPTFNIGNYERNLLVWSPEASIKAQYRVSDRLSVTVGYTILYWTRVALAGDQVDTNVNRDVTFDGAYVPGGGARPAFAWRDTDFWVQTIDLGLLLNY
ncbi:MAG: BBP7 family outer membrane beta-barrel protein [Planctomycetaceae bacterium]|nr:BBP7 family outer membrane beta-barrel protein [Planctomycetales bacterium]MCB9924061.1 BBP7 family outer membrane beta-barrel protein [Planctomycetaceae bacterium]